MEDAAAKINICDDKFVTLYGEKGAQGLVSVEVEGESISKKRSVATRLFWNNKMPMFVETKVHGKLV